MSEILIIGGGVIGLLTARELAQAGAEVTLVEMGRTGREASWAGGGILSPLYPWRYSAAVNDLVQWSQQVYPDLCCTLLEETGIDPEYEPMGLLILDPEQHDLAFAWAERRDVGMAWLDPTEIEELEPGLVAPTEGALWLKDVAQIRNPRLVQALRASVEKRITIREQEEVNDLILLDGRVRGVRTTKGTIAAERIVVCAGAWTAQLLEQIGAVPSIRPVRGQMMLFHAKSAQIRRITLFRERYVIPRRDGRVLVGGTLEEAGFEKMTTAAAKEDLYRAAVELFPLLRRTPIEDHWAGLRPGSPNGVPYICAYPAVHGLFLNAGHFRNGLVTGPASARLAADLVLGRPPTFAPESYSLEVKRG